MPSIILFVLFYDSTSFNMGSRHKHQGSHVGGSVLTEVASDNFTRLKMLNYTFSRPKLVVRFLEEIRACDGPELL